LGSQEVARGEQSMGPAKRKRSQVTEVRGFVGRIEEGRRRRKKGQAKFDRPHRGSKEDQSEKRNPKKCSAGGTRGDNREDGMAFKFTLGPAERRGRLKKSIAEEAKSAQ